MSSSAENSVFTYHFSVAANVIDRNGHVNNVAYVQWMQDAAVRHSKAVLSDELYASADGTWFARSHHVEYLSPVLVNEEIEVRTWLSAFRRVRCTRKYEFIRVQDQQLVARGQTDWVYVSRDSGRPRSIPDSLRHAFGLEE